VRFDNIHEQDRFIPGWHHRREPRRAELSRPQWQWPARLRRAVLAAGKGLLAGLRHSLPNRQGSRRAANV
jgi:hypothetical protein